MDGIALSFIVFLAIGIFLILSWIVNLIQVIGFLAVPIVKWTPLMLIKSVGIPLGYGAVLGALEIFHLI